MAWNVRKVAKHCVFAIIRASEGSKSRLAKAAGVVALQQRNEKLHAAVAQIAWENQNVQKHRMLRPLFEVQISKNYTVLWPEVHFQVKMHKTPRGWSIFRGLDIEKLNADVAWSTCERQDIQNTACLHILRFRCRKTTRCCGAKHILS